MPQSRLQRRLNGCGEASPFVKPEAVGHAVEVPHTLCALQAGAVAEHATYQAPHEGGPMARRSAVLLVGWNPDVVDYSKWPGLTAEKLRAALESDRAKFDALGYDAELGLIDSAETSDMTLRTLLAAKRRDCVLIGAGVRTIPDYLHTFERLINTFHECAPNARLCFNSGAFDSVDAVQRWVPASSPDA